MKKLPYLILAVLCTSLLFTSCAGLLIAGGAAAGAGTIYYLEGDLEKTLEYSYPSVFEASKEAIEDQDLKLILEKKGLAKGSLKAKDNAGTVYVINLKREATNTTHISIRVGTFGDEALSRQLLAAIEDEL